MIMTKEEFEKMEESWEEFSKEFKRDALERVAFIRGYQYGIGECRDETVED